MFTFTPSQVRGVIWLLPLLAVFGVIFGLSNKPSFEKSFMELADSAMAGRNIAQGVGSSRTSNAPQTDTTRTSELFAFDPNTATLQEFCRLGLNARTAAGIIKYRERGKRFEIPQDFAACYGVTLEDYTLLEPYIRIGDAYRLKSAGSSNAEPFKAAKNDETLAAFDPNLLDAAGFVALGFSPKQADVIVRYRHSIGGFRSKDDFAKCFVVSEQMMRRLGQYIVVGEGSVPDENTQKVQNAADGGRAASADVVGSAAIPKPAGPVELNSADSATLRSVNGIGEVLVVRIMEYRERLGGFASAAQLSEIRGMSEENRLWICEQIRVDSCVIQKIDINFAPHKTLVEQMGRHPYVTDVILRKLLKNRQLKGGWRNIGEMVEQDILTDKEAQKLSPYLLFRSE